MKKCANGTTGSEKEEIMRTIIVVLWLVFFVLSSLIMLPIAWLMKKKNPVAAQRLSQKYSTWILKGVVVISGCPVTVKGLDRIPRDEPVLFAMNHRGIFDILVVYMTVPVLMGFISKKEWKKIPFLRAWMVNCKCLFLDRENPREGLKTILEGAENIKAGTSMCIAPEGTRNHGDELLPFKPGSLKMAEKTNCKIVPIALKNTDAAFELQAPWIKKVPISVEYGDPIDVASMSKEEKRGLEAIVKERIETMLKA